MANQSNSQNNTARKAELEKRTMNGKIAMYCFIALLAIGLADTFGIVDAFVWMWSASPWAAEIKAATYVVTATSFLGAVGVGIWATKQNT